MADSVKRRSYDSSGRREAARARRQRSLRAASELFLANGYQHTTVAAIAERAGVSEDLIFQLFTSKRGVLKVVMDVVIGGDDEEIPLLEREGPQAVRAATDQREQLRLFTAGITSQLDRVRPLNDLMRSAAAVEPEIAALHDDLHLRQRRHAMHMVATWLTENGPLRNEMTVETAGSILWTLASPDVHRMLTVQNSWTSQQYQDWLRETLTATLLP
ncbi:MAG: helix-turn-helix domain-containing protein [Actinomycetota bacterium]